MSNFVHICYFLSKQKEKSLAVKLLGQRRYLVLILISVPQILSTGVVSIYTTTQKEWGCLFLLGVIIYYLHVALNCSKVVLIWKLSSQLGGKFIESKGQAFYYFWIAFKINNITWHRRSTVNLFSMWFGRISQLNVNDKKFLYLVRVPLNWFLPQCSYYEACFKQLWNECWDEALWFGLTDSLASVWAPIQVHPVTPHQQV